ncbi:Cell cycle checkpoint protein RAD17-like [Homarus americanus]|uniref:Cell cycle checkpoint protein RAD17-like n=1 Tax=Homarus americanus TaxID=6706 RepID=A0A8J5JXQ6_HOMAM|nr:Cell cycle checkpoint protein RAD17-like [Homarus americanus]
MSLKNSGIKGSSWVTSAFDDFGLSSSPPARKRGREEDLFPQPGKKIQQGGSALWNDLYSPLTRDDLAIHKKKVQTATVRVLVKEAGLNLLEWTNPTTTPYNSSFMEQENIWIPGDTVRPASQTSQFWDFFIRTSKYRSVCGTGKQDNVVCVEDFPNAFYRDPSTFHALLRRYNERGITSPVFFIMSDSTNHQSSAKHLFPPDLQQELGIINIVFNPIASGLLVKAMSRVVQMESLCARGRGQSLPTKEALQMLAETSGGDIRSAINALQFACKKDINQLEGLFTGTSGKGRTLTRTKSQTKSHLKKNSSTKTQESDLDGFAAVGGKDASLFLFRALGKVLYCKRKQDEGVTEPLPKHLQPQERTPLLENPESIYDNTSMGATSFSMFLHHNCLNFFPDIESDREVLEDYSASVTVRGLMHANRGGSSGGGWRSFTKPQWYSVFREGQQSASALRDEYRMASLTSEELATTVLDMCDADTYITEHDITMDTVTTRRLPPSSSRTEELTNEEDPEEDFLIEEFDDD